MRRKKFIVWRIRCKKIMKRTPEEMAEEIIALYRQGMSPYQIERFFEGKITHGGARKVILRAGIPTRNRSEVKQRYNLDMEKIVHLYLDDQWSTYRIGQEFNVPPSVIWSRLNQAGIKTRSNHEAKTGDDGEGDNPSDMDT